MVGVFKLDRVGGGGLNIFKCKYFTNPVKCDIPFIKINTSFNTLF